MKKLALLFCFALFAQSAMALQLNVESFLRKQMDQKILKSYTWLVPSVPAVVGKFDQKVNHFARSSSDTFKQRYWIQSDWASGKKAPVFYIICGESTCEGADSMGAINALARKYKAHLVALEHRFYGESIPSDRLSRSALKMLSTEQALADLSNFQNWVREQFGLSGKWIAVGGSYPGSLSAFYREKYPEQVVGSLASSAPVLSKADFWEYDRHVAKVAGSKCLANIRKAVTEAENLLAGTPEQIKKVKTMFQVESFKDSRDVLYVLADIAAFAIQYGYHQKFCDGLNENTVEGSLLDAYAKQGLALLSNFGVTPYQISFVSAENEDPASYDGFAGMRSWMYQSCTEFGYFQVANGNGEGSARSSQITLEFHEEVCKRLFGLKGSVPTTKTNNEYYFPLFKTKTTNIYFTNGANDPWINLSVAREMGNAELNPGLSVFTIAGASHCEDLGSRFTSALSQSRSQFAYLIETWLR